MPWFDHSELGHDYRKPWRYPGVPIPFRLQHRYKNPAPVDAKRRRR